MAAHVQRFMDKGEEDPTRWSKTRAPCVLATASLIIAGARRTAFSNLSSTCDLRNL